MGNLLWALDLEGVADLAWLWSVEWGEEDNIFDHNYNLSILWSIWYFSHILAGMEHHPLWIGCFDHPKLKFFKKFGRWWVKKFFFQVELNQQFWSFVTNIFQKKIGHCQAIALNTFGHHQPNWVTLQTNYWFPTETQSKYFLATHCRNYLLDSVTPTKNKRYRLWGNDFPVTPTDFIEQFLSLITETGQLWKKYFKYFWKVCTWFFWVYRLQISFFFGTGYKSLTCSQWTQQMWKIGLNILAKKINYIHNCNTKKMIYYIYHHHKGKTTIMYGSWI